MMKNAVVSAVVLGLISICTLTYAPASQADDDSACNAVSGQQPRNACKADAYRKLDDKLQHDYQRLAAAIDEMITEYKDLKDDEDVLRVSKQKEKLVSAQEAWIKYRKAQCDFIGSYYENGDMHGSEEGEAVGDCLNDITKRRDIEINASFEQYEQELVHPVPQ